MRWPSTWSNGFPGWHLECSAMSTKYLGEQFDIHGGGMDLLFPHHECEIAQSTAANGKESVKYWMHNNMITINGQKMGKSLGNFITLDEFFSGNHKVLDKPYSPMTVRFFILQAHYRSTVDFSNEALQAAEKGLERLLKAGKVLQQLRAGKESTINIKPLKDNCYQAMNDDLNSPILIAHLFEAVRLIHLLKEGKENLNTNDLEQLKNLYHTFVYDILGLQEEASDRSELTSDLIDMILTLRLEAKKNKDFDTADKIRDELTQKGIKIKDTKDGYEWEV